MKDLSAQVGLSIGRQEGTTGRLNETIWKVRSLERIHSAYVLQFIVYKFLKLSDNTVLCGQFLQSLYPLSFVNHQCLWQ